MFFDLLLTKYQSQKVLRALAWITRFISNCQNIKKRGSLITSEIQGQRKFYIKREQRKVEHSEKSEETKIYS